MTQANTWICTSRGNGLLLLLSATLVVTYLLILLSAGVHSLANCDSCPTPAKSEAIEYLQVGPTEIRYSIAWTIFVYL